MFMELIKAFFLAPARIAALEAKIVELEAALAKAKITNSLSLVSPDGTRKIDMVCQNSNAGIWISGGAGQPMVAIYDDANQGAVIGLWGQADKDGYRRSGLDAAMSYCPTSGGTIQLMSPDNILYDIVPGNAACGVGTKMTPHTIKF